MRVIRLDDHLAVYTLHGHCSPVPSAFIDANDPSCAGSGSQNGMLCVWDLYTGACLYSVQAHDGAVLSLAYSPSYVVSMGGDDKLCVWERVQGHLINSISLVRIRELSDNCKLYSHCFDSRDINAKTSQSHFVICFLQVDTM